MRLHCQKCAEAMGMDVKCDFMAEGATKEEAMEKGMAHMQTDHPDAVAAWMKMSPEDQEQMKQKMMNTIEA